jgi:hypothetical protein
MTDLARALDGHDVVARIKRHVDEYKSGGPDREAEDIALCQEVGLATDNVIGLWANSRREKAAAAAAKASQARERSAFAEMRRQRDKKLADYQAREPEEDGQAVLKRLLGMGAAPEP